MPIHWSKLYTGLQTPCASMGCRGVTAVWFFEAGNVGSFYCDECKQEIENHMTEDKKQPLPVKGYSPQSQETINLVNEGKELEERYLRWLDKVLNQIDPPSDTKPMSYKYDARCLAEARTHIQTGAMWAIRAIFKPQRIKLPEDTQ